MEETYYLHGLLHKLHAYGLIMNIAQTNTWRQRMKMDLNMKKSLLMMLPFLLVRVYMCSSYYLIQFNNLIPIHKEMKILTLPFIIYMWPNNPVQ